MKKPAKKGPHGREEMREMKRGKYMGGPAEERRETKTGRPKKSVKRK